VTAFERAIVSRVNPRKPDMKNVLVPVLEIVVLLLSIDGYAQDLKVKNALEAVTAAIFHLQENNAQNTPESESKWQEKTIYSGGPVDLATTARQYRSDSWWIEVTQELAPLRNTVYQVTVFGSKTSWYWKGSVKADGTVTDASAFRRMTEEEKEKTAELFLKRSLIPPPQGGYGH
jgi:hypothetical protein